ncbi:MAG: U32 family peptidase C-terminal domain-containing protein, partial [Lachnospiraceae bacterium]|nr:U32 family peptidase C-terminal domain-containing protein [Lachnospiraceae bacterium]
LEGIRVYLKELKKLHPDALIIADPGVFTLAGEICPEIDRHISTQANNTNAETFLFWHRLGARRVVTARELSLQEIREIRQQVPEDLEIESFVHGAMCISYSGRCLLSNYFTGRDANRGACTHPCRWKYLTAPEEDAERLAELEQETRPGEKMAFLQEETRPGEYLPVLENERGTFIFNSKDLCMIDHIPDLMEAGIDSYKIEGRMKSALYVATVARTYRKAIDDYLEDPALYQSHMDWYLEQIADCTYRQFTTGFYYHNPSSEDQIYDSNTYITNYVCLGIAEGEDENGYTVLRQKNKFSVGDRIEVMKPDGSNPEVIVEEIRDEEGNPMDSAPHPQQEVHVKLGGIPKPFDILRMRKG